MAEERSGYEHSVVKLNLLTTMDAHAQTLSLLDDQGSDGWELVSVVPQVSSGNTVSYLAFFKRQK